MSNWLLNMSVELLILNIHFTSPVVSIDKNSLLLFYPLSLVGKLEKKKKKGYQHLKESLLILVVLRKNRKHSLLFPKFSHSVSKIMI